MPPIVVSRAVDAPAQTLWDVVVDVESWPRWTSSVRSASLLDGELALGRRAALEQPRLPAQVWTVTAFEAGRSFSWSTHSGGVTTEGVHEVRADGDGSRIVLTLSQTGLLAPVVGLLLGRLSRRYVELEAAGLTAAAGDRGRR